MERIEINHNMRRAWRWLSTGIALPIPYLDALAKVQRGLAQEVAS